MDSFDEILRQQQLQELERRRQEEEARKAAEADAMRKQAGAQKASEQANASQASAPAPAAPPARMPGAGAPPPPRRVVRPAPDPGRQKVGPVEVVDHHGFLTRAISSGVKAFASKTVGPAVSAFVAGLAPGPLNEGEEEFLRGYDRSAPPIAPKYDDFVEPPVEIPNGFEYDFKGVHRWVPPLLVPPDVVGDPDLFPGQMPGRVWSPIRYDPRTPEIEVRPGRFFPDERKGDVEAPMPAVRFSVEMSRGVPALRVARAARIRQRPSRDQKTAHPLYLGGLRMINATYGAVSEAGDLAEAVLWGLWSPVGDTFVPTMQLVHGDAQEAAFLWWSGRARFDLPSVLFSVAYEELSDAYYGSLGRVNAAAAQRLGIRPTGGGMVDLGGALGGPNVLSFVRSRWVSWRRQSFSSW